MRPVATKQGSLPQRVDVAQRPIVRRHRTAERGDAGKLTGMIPGGAQRHRAAAADAGEEDALRVNVEAALGNFDAIEDARFGLVDRVAALAASSTTAARCGRCRCPAGRSPQSSAC